MPVDLTYAQIAAMVGVSRGRHDSITIPFVFVDWLGSYEAAAMFTQMLYWDDVARSQGKSYFLHSLSEWVNELHLAEKRIVSCIKHLKLAGVNETAKGHFDGSPMFAYTVDHTRFILAFHTFTSRESRSPSLVDPFDADVTDPFHGRAPEWSGNGSRARDDRDDLQPDDSALAPIIQIDTTKARALRSVDNLDFPAKDERLDVDNNIYTSTRERAGVDQTNQTNPYSAYASHAQAHANTRPRGYNGRYLPEGVEPGAPPARRPIDLSAGPRAESGATGAHVGGRALSASLYNAETMPVELDPGPYGDWAKTKGPRPIPPNYDPGPKLRRWWETTQAAEPGAESIRINLQVGAFIDYWNEKKRTTDDVDALFRNWLRKKIHYKQTDHSGGSGAKRKGDNAVTANSFAYRTGRAVRLEPADIYSDDNSARKMRAADVPHEDVELLAEMRDSEPPEQRIKYVIREVGLFLKDTIKMVSMADKAIEIWRQREEPVETFVMRVRAAARIGPRDLAELLLYVEQGVV